MWKRLLLQCQTNRSISNIPETVFLLLTAEGLFIIKSLFHFVQCFFLMESSSLTSIKQPKKLESAMNSLQPAELNMRWSRHYEHHLWGEWLLRNLTLTYKRKLWDFDKVNWLIFFCRHAFVHSLIYESAHCPISCVCYIDLIP